MNPGQKRPEANNDLVNERIRFPEVLVIGPDGSSLGKMSSRAANDMANRYELDLLCVAPNANPPVCKILNYGKYRFEAQKRAKESRKNQKIIEIKEVQLTPQIGIHDLMVKVKGAIGFFQDGNKVKVGVRFRGRQLAHPEVGKEVLDKFIELVQEYASVEKEGELEGKWMTAILASKIKK
ncbi:MAG TPA: translation initiation factor IF-3 [Bacilli bacterium]|jgi:translation initiation factor IF-3|nr:translation initiation factor IF-3 [Bacilli bacterium]